MKPASKRRNKRGEPDESDEDAPLAEVSKCSPGCSQSDDAFNGKGTTKRRNNKQASESEDESDQEKDKKRKNDKRRSGKKPKHSSENQVNEALNKSGSDYDDAPLKKKESKTLKEKTPKKGKGKRDRKRQVKIEDGEPTNGNANENIDYEVEDIIDKRIKHTKLQYLIHWKGYGPEHDTWERADGLKCPDIIKRYKQRSKEEREAESSGDEKTEEFEVSRILEVHFRRDGSREFLVGWKGYSSKDNTWEHEKNMKCPEMIAQFMRRVDQAKEKTPRELREHREPTKHYIANTFDVLGRRLSGRSRNKPRVNYFYDDQY